MDESYDWTVVGSAAGSFRAALVLRARAGATLIFGYMVARYADDLAA